MALAACKVDGKPGYQHAKDAPCNTYTEGDEASMKRAKMKSMKQAMKKNGNVPLHYDDADDVALQAEVETMLADDLETVTLKGVEILSAGGPYFGQGSPEDGDFFDDDYLHTLVANNKLLAGQVDPPNKVGHSSRQQLLANSGMLDEGEKPAAGWLTNFAVRKRGGVAKIFVDIEDVPAKLARLIKSKAFRKRSVEMATVTSQAGETQGQKFRVISGLAWLGAKAPAVKTLDDIVALYADEEETAEALLREDEEPDDERGAVPVAIDGGTVTFEDWRCVDYAEGEIVWDPKNSFEAVRCAVQDALGALTPSTPGGAIGEQSFWVRDVTDGKALVSRYLNGTTEYYVIPFKRGTDGTAELADADKWTEAREAWVQTAERYDEHADTAATTFARSRDTSAMTVSEHVKGLTVEQAKALAESFGIEVGEDEKFREALTSKLSEMSEAKNEGDGGDEGGDGDEGDGKTDEPSTPDVKLQAELEVFKAKAERGDKAYEQMRVDRIASALKKAVSDGRLDPAKIETWRGFCDRDEETSLSMLDELPVNKDFLTAYGSDEDAADEDATDAADKHYAEWARYSGVEIEEGA